MIFVFILVLIALAVLVLVLVLDDSSSGATGATQAMTHAQRPGA